MKSVYVDTSVLIAKYKTNDKIHNPSVKILTSINANFVISHISLVELASVISRQIENINFNKEIDEKIGQLNFKERIMFLLNYIVHDNKLQIIQHNGFENLPFITENQIFSDYSRAMIQSADTSLRTLDNLHLGAAKNLMVVKNYKIDYFVTGENEILSKKRIISQYLDILVISPHDLVRVES